MRQGLRKKAKPEKQVKAREMRKAPTASEARLWEALRCKRAGVKFRRQAIILGWIADFYCPTRKVVVEVDGSSHANKESYDKHRDDVMQRHGLRVLRFTNTSVFNDLGGVIGQIKAAVA